MKKRRAKSREFEMLAARIESALAPQGARVKSPDRIRDKFTGQYREVDASIRHTIGSCRMLITIECRDRSRVQDVTWIEQIATKRSHVGADRTLAVSSTPFSDPAMRAARAHGISVRLITDVTEEDIRSLTNPLEVTVKTIDIALQRVTLGYWEPPTEPPQLVQQAREALQLRTWDAPIFKHIDSKRPLSLSEIIDKAHSAPAQHLSGLAAVSPKTPESQALFPHNPLIAHLGEVPSDGSDISKTMTLSCDRGEVSVETNVGILSVRQIEFVVAAKRSTQRVLPSRVSQYATPGRVIGRFTEHKIQLSVDKSIIVTSHPSNLNTEPEGET